MMLRVIVLSFLAVAVHSAATAVQFGFDPAAEPEKAKSVYFAPENQLTFKMVFPRGGAVEFERDYSSPVMGLRGADGWSAEFSGDGKITVRGSNDDGKMIKFIFNKGRLVEFKFNGKRHIFDYAESRPPPAGNMSPLAVSPEDGIEAAKDYVQNEFEHKWDGTGRLSFPFINPNQNGVLLAELLLVCVGGLSLLRRRAIKTVCMVAGAFFAACLVWTMSRGAWLGFAVGLLPFALLMPRGLLKEKGMLLLLGGFALALGGWLLFSGSGEILRGFSSQSSWTNKIRLEMWSNVPRMMFDAPGGWAFANVGTAYLNWYQPLTVFALTPTLINDHLTHMVAVGWFGRFLYVFICAMLFAVATTVMVRRRNPLPLSLWLAFAAAAWFNPVAHRWTLWLIPVVSSVGLVHFPWRSVRAVLIVSCAALAASVAVCVGLYVKGGADARRYDAIRADGRRTLFRSVNPRVWIVDDGMLGGGLTGKDIREFYSVERAAPGLGYVTSVADLPPGGIDRLVLSGYRGSDWLMMLSEDPLARKNLPKSVVFVSPPFQPSDIPEGVLKCCRVKVLVGEFAARYESGYANVPDWVMVVPGMERYILRWMWYVMEG